SAVEFEVKNGTVACIRLDETKTVAIPAVPESNVSIVTGTCGDGTASSATMTVDFGEDVGKWGLVFMKENPVVLEQTFNFTPSLLFNGSVTNESVILSAQSQNLSTENSSFVCKSLLTVAFSGNSTDNYTYTMTQAITNLQVQAFNLEANGTFSPSEECAGNTTTAATTTETNTTMAPGNTTEVTTEPATTTEPPVTTTLPPPSKPNTYTVNGNNETCIVFQATIIFNNFTYEKKDNTTGTVNDIFIPYNSSDVQYSGNCGDENSTTQTLNITFNTDWQLTLTFAKGAAEDASQLGASDKYSLRDIDLTYNTTSFPDVKTGGSYRCDTNLPQSLSNGVVFETRDLQYKAFNTDNDTTFSSDNVSECPGDDESNSIVPIAVGAALAGLVVIVLIAYLIGRRRSKRQGYESV
ncbi:hypothetical protein BaRGS_00024021, partial [Batillaria attramentaria]